MQFQGVIKKMATWQDNPIKYYLNLSNELVSINDLLGKEIEIEHIGYECLSCGAPKKIFRQGFCYDCFTNAPEAGEWIMHPELSKAHLDIEDRDLEYEKRVQLQPHILYFAVASDLKIGVTRKTQVPTRWIDQGASFAIPIVEVPNRYLAGIAEVALKAHYTDKTNWRKMLQNDILNIDLVAAKQQVKELLPSEVLPYFNDASNELFSFNYPLTQPIDKIVSVNLEKSPKIKGKLIGVKAQYLLFDEGVWNLRANEGYVINMQF